MASDLQQAPKPSVQSKYESYVTDQLRRAQQRIRLLDLSASVLGMAGLTLAYALAIALLDRWLELSGLARQLAFCCYGLGVALYLGLAVLRPLFLHLNPYYAARQIEVSMPGVKNSVVNWLDLHGRELPAAVQLAIGHRAAKDLARADLEQAIRSRRISWIGAIVFGLLLGVAILFLLGPRQFVSLMSRAFAPFGGSAAIATRTQLTILKPEGGDATVAVGRAVNLAVYVEGKVPEPNRSDSLRLHLRYGEGEPWQERALERGDSGREWGIVIPAQHVQNGFWYRITGGDAATPEHRVQVRSTPLLTGFEVTYRYRPYLGWKDETNHDPNLRAIRGTAVDLVARTNRAVQSGQLTIENEAPIAAEKLTDDPQALRFRLALEKDASYRIWFTSREGERNVEPMAYTIRVVQDAPPQVEVLKPGDTTLASNAVLTVEGTAQDDFGVTGMTLQMQVKDGPRLKAKPYRPGTALAHANGQAPRKIEYRDFTALDQVVQESGQPFALAPGMQLKYWLEASDNCDHPGPNVGRSEEFTIQIEPPNQEEEKQQKEREQNRQDQKRHESKQDQQLKQQPPQPKDDKPSAEQPPERKPSDDQKDLEKKAEQLRKAIEKNDEDKKGQEQPKQGQEKDKQEQPKQGSDQSKNGKEQPKQGQEKDKQEQSKQGGDKSEGGQEQPKQGQEKDKQEQSKKGSDKSKNGTEQPKEGQGKDKQAQSKQGGEQSKSGQEQQKQGGEQPKAGQEQSKPGGDPSKQMQDKPQPGAQQSKQAPDASKDGQEKSKDGQGTGNDPSRPVNEGSKPEQGKEKGNDGQRQPGQGQEKPGSKAAPSKQKGNPGADPSKSKADQGEEKQAQPDTSKPGSDPSKPIPAESKDDPSKSKQAQDASKQGDSQEKSKQGTGSEAETGSKSGEKAPKTKDQSPGNDPRKGNGQPETMPEPRQTKEKASADARKPDGDQSKQTADGQEKKPGDGLTKGQKQIPEKKEGPPGETGRQTKPAGGEQKQQPPPPGTEEGQPKDGKGQPSKQAADKQGSGERKADGLSKQSAKSKESDSKAGGKPAGASNPGESGSSGREGGTKPSTKDQPPPEAGPSDEGSDGAPKSAEPGDKPDASHRRRAGDLQLEDFKKRVNKDVLKKANMTEAEYQQFLKAYEEMLRSKAVPPVEPEKLTGPQRGGGDLSNQGARRVVPGTTDKAGPLQRTGPALPPPEFRDAAREFSRMLSELQRAAEKK